MTEQNGPRVKRLEFLFKTKEETIESLEKTIRDQKALIVALTIKIARTHEKKEGKLKE